MWWKKDRNEMNIISLDCEYNLSKKTIQIGAAAYKATTGELLGTFETFVNPNEQVDQPITELTGINTSDVSGAPDILEAFQTLAVFHKKHKCFKNPLVWGTNASNDSDHIYREAYPNEDVPNFMGRRVIDVKDLYQSIQILYNKSVSGSLEDVCNKRLEIGFEGRPHTALADAQNTFRVWYFLVKKFSVRGFK